MPTTKRKEIGHAEDDTCGSYEWSYASVCEEDGRFIVVTGSGCSCNCPDIDYDDVVLGPAATLGGIFDELFVDKDKHSKAVKEAFVDALVRMNADTLERTKKALDL